MDRKLFLRSTGMIVSAVLITALIAAIVLYLYIFAYPAYQAKIVADEFLSSLVSRDWDKAFENVAYYDKFTDVSPSIPYEEAERLWIARVSSLAQHKTYLKSFYKMRTYTDDGYPKGDVTIKAIKNGRLHTYEAEIMFSRSKGELKVQGLIPQSFEGKLVGLEHAISGDMRASH